MKALKKIFILLFVGFQIISCDNSVNRTHSSNEESTLSKIIKSRKLKVGYVVYPPIVQKDPTTGELSGHFVDAINFLASEIDAEVEFHEADWATFSAGLQSGKYDVSIAPTYTTIKRAKSVSFTNTIIYIGSHAVARKIDSAKFKTLSDLNASDVVVAVVQGEGNHEFAKRELSNANLKVLSTSNMMLPLIEITSGNADIALTDAYTANKFVSENKGLTIITPQPFDLLPIGWAVRHADTELLNFLNNALAYMTTTGRMDKWEAAYDAHWVKQKIEFSVK